MSIISTSYFIGPIALPPNKYDLLSGYITRYENQILYKLFGYTLGNLVIDYNISTSPQRIKDIVEGKEYLVTDLTGVYMPTSGDVTIKWNGLVNTELKSLIAYWVFYWYCRENETNITPSGGIIPKVEDAINVGFNGKAIFSWRELLQLYGYIGQPKIQPSCFNFMQENIETYPEWTFENIGRPGEVNIFGI